MLERIPLVAIMRAGAGEKPFETFLKIPPFWRAEPSLNRASKQYPASAST